MAINRTPFNALVDDDGSNTVGSIWNKNAIKTVILDPVDAELALKAPLGTWTAVTYSAANFVGTGTMAWTVDAGDQIRFAYMLNGKTMAISFYLDTTTLSGTATGEVRLTIPGGYSAKGWSVGYLWIVVGALGIPGTIRSVPAATYLSLFKTDLTNFSLGTNNVVLAATFIFEVN